MVDAVINVDVQANLGNLSRDLDKAKGMAGKADKELESLARSTTTLTKSSNGMANALSGVSQEVSTAVKGFKSMTTSIKLTEGSIVGYTARMATAAAGTGELGGKLIALASRSGGLAAIPLLAGAAALAVAALADSNAKLRNSLLTIPAISVSAGTSFEFLQGLAIDTKRPLTELTELYKTYATELSALGVPLDQINEQFATLQKALSALRADTVSDAFSRLKDALSARAGSGWFRDITVGGMNWLANVVQPAQIQVGSLTRQIQLLDMEIASLATRMRDLERSTNKNILTGRELEDIDEQLATALQKRKELTEQQQAADRLLYQSGKDAVDALTKGLRDEIAIREHIIKLQQQGMSLAQAEAQGQVLRLRQQAFAKAPQTPEGRESVARALVESEKHTTPALKNQAALQDSLRQSQFELQQFMGLITGQRTILDAESTGWSTYADRVAEAMRRAAAANLDQTEVARTQLEIRRQLAQQEQEQALQTAQLAAQALTTLWPKSKAAAIASAIINTSVGITRALSSLNPPLSYVQAALIAAMGAKQIATIRSTNFGSGSTPSTGGGGGGSTAAAVAAPTAPAAPTNPEAANVLNIQLKKNQRWTSNEVDELMQRIAERTKDGKTILKTELT